MKALIGLFLTTSFSISAMAAPVVLSQLTVCKENQKQPQPLTVIWSQDGQNQTLTFSGAQGSATYPVLQTQLSDYGASIVTYRSARGNEHVTIFCDAIMTNDDELMTVSSCGNGY